MATIADAFLLDFDSGDDDDEDFKQNDSDMGADDDELAASVRIRDIDAEDEQYDIITADSVESIATLLRNEEVKAHLETIEKLSNEVIDYHGNKYYEQRDHEYKLIVRSNELTLNMDNEILLIYKFLRDIYVTKLKDLESIIPNPIEFARVVKKIGNEMDLTLVDLSDILPHATILTITVTASASTGQPLPPDDLKKAMDACDAILELDEAKRKIYKYVESRMELIAPNLTALVGAEVSARLMSIAGGLTQLSRMPSCNIQVLGAQRRHLGGYALASINPHMGLLAQTDLMMLTPNDLKRKVLRLLASKCALGARADSFQENITGDLGMKFRDEVKHKLEKAVEPPPPKKTKALPVPDDKPRRKRGGRKYRKMKEMLKMSELAKQKDRIMFGVAQHVDEYTGEEMGMIGLSGTGNLRIQNRTKQKAVGKTKKFQEQQQQQKMRRAAAAAASASSSSAAGNKGTSTSGNKGTSTGVSTGGGAAGMSASVKAGTSTGLNTAAGRASSKNRSSGLASTIALTPVQGMELINPDAAKEREAEASQKYFSSTAGFMRVGGKANPPVPKFQF